MMLAGTHHVVRGALRESGKTNWLLIVASNSHWLNDPIMEPCDFTSFDGMFEAELVAGAGCRGAGPGYLKHGDPIDLSRVWII